MQHHHLAALIALFVAVSGPALAQSITAITAIPQADNEGNTTVNLHAFDGTTFCEVRGTAVFAPNGPGLKIPPGVFEWPNGPITKDKAAQ